MATGPPIPDDLRKSGDVGHPSARSAAAQAGRKGGWPVSDRLPICDRLLRTAQSVEPCSLREEGPLPDWLVASRTPRPDAATRPIRAQARGLARNPRLT